EATRRTAASRAQPGSQGGIDRGRAELTTTAAETSASQRVPRRARGLNAPRRIPCGVHHRPKVPIRMKRFALSAAVLGAVLCVAAPMAEAASPRLVVRDPVGDVLD